MAGRSSQRSWPARSSLRWGWWLTHRFIVSRVTGSGAPASEGAGAYGQILTTLGLSLILQNGALIVFGSTPTAIRIAAVALVLGDRRMSFLNQGRCVSFFVAIAVAAAVYLFLGHTRLGKGLRAAADNGEWRSTWASTCDRAHRLAWSLGVGSLPTRAGSSPARNPSNPYVGFDFVIVMYSGVVLGGLGSILGAFWGGLLIGIVQQISTLVFPSSAAEHLYLHCLPADHFPGWPQGCSAGSASGHETASWREPRRNPPPALGDRRGRCCYPGAVAGVTQRLLLSWF